MTTKKSVVKFIGVACVAWPVFTWAQANEAPQVDNFTQVKPSESCTTTSCPAGAYLVKTTDELARIGSLLETKGQVKQETGHWTNDRYAILVNKGHYNTAKPFHLGYYTQVLGVGHSPDDVMLNPGVTVLNQCLDPAIDPDGWSCKFTGGLNNFWRGIENIQMHGERLAISQATAIRRIHVTGDELLLCDWQTPDWSCGFTSGGFLANSKIDNKYTLGSQQQWLTRNSDFSEAQLGAWNSIFVGSKGTIATPSSVSPHQGPDGNNWEGFPLTEVAQTPVVREKPYLVRNDDATWQVVVPALKKASSGHNWDDSNAKKLDISQFYVMESKPDANGVTTIDSTEIAKINAALAEKNHHLLIMPGVYNLQGSINVSQEDTVVLGIGIPALVCSTKAPCLNINVEKGVTVAGITFDAGYELTPYLVRVGAAKTVGDNSDKTDNSANPTALFDVYARIAETQKTTRDPSVERQTKTALIINSNDVIGDNLWIWRGDHDKASGDSPDSFKNLVKWNENKAQYGVIVNGNDVSMYGLAVEHFQDYQTLWYGEKGQVYFYQSEAPYDVLSTGEKWVCVDPVTDKPTKDKGCAAYVVADNVKNHTAYGIGVYTYFAFDKVQLPSGIKAPAKDGINITHVIGRWLNGVPGSGLLNLVKDYTANSCWGFQATCLDLDTDSRECKDKPLQNMPVLGAFSKDTYANTQVCTAPSSATSMTKP